MPYKNIEDKNEINLKDILAVVYRRKWLLIIPFILVTIITYAASYLITPIYESSTIVAINPQLRLSTDLQRLLGVQDNMRTRSNEENELRSIYNDVTSTYYISQLVQKMNLDKDPSLLAQVQNVVSKYPGLNQNDVALDLLQNDLRENVSVRFAAQDHVMITVQSPVPKRAQDIANYLGEIYISEKMKQELASIRTSQDFSDTQLQKYEALLQQKIDERTALQKRLLQVQLDQGIGSESNRIDLKTEIDRTTSDISDAQKEQALLSAELNKIPGLSSANLELKPTPELDGLKADLKQQVDAITAVSQSYPWNDPQVLNLKLKQNSILTSIQNLNKRLVDNQFSTQSTPTRETLTKYFNNKSIQEFLYSKSFLIKAALDQLTDKMKIIPDIQAQLTRVDEEIRSATTLRNQFKSQQEGTNISQALFQDVSASKYRVVEPAKLGLTPVKPDRIKILVMGLILGLVIGSAAVVLFELFDSSFKKVIDVQESLDLPVLAITPKIEFINRIRK